MAETSSMELAELVQPGSGENHSPSISNIPLSRPRLKPFTTPFVTKEDIAKELLERAEEKQRSYSEGVDVRLAMKQPSSPLKIPRKDEGKLDACELLSILEGGVKVHCMEKPKPNKVPRLSRGPYKDKLDPEIEKRLALQQLMEFSQKRGRPKKSDAESNNNNNNNNNEAQGSSDSKSVKKNTVNKDIKATPREVRQLLGDEGAINMLYSIEKGETDSTDKILPSKRRKKKALIKKTQEVTEALLGGTSSIGVSLRHRSLGKKRKLSTDSIDSEQSEFHFKSPSDSKIIRRHSSSSSYSSRASSPRLSSPPVFRSEEGVRNTERTEQLLEVKCKELNLQEEYSQAVKCKLNPEKHNGFKEKIQSAIAKLIRAPINRHESSISSSPEKTSILKMVEEDWGSGSDTEPDHRPKENGREPSSSGFNKSLPLAVPAPQIQESIGDKTETREEFKDVTKQGYKELKEDGKDRRLPREMSSYREIVMTVNDGLGCLSLAINSTKLPHALSTKVLRELSLALEYMTQSADIKCITLISDGLDFCLGFDLPELLSIDQIERRALATQAALAIKELAFKVCMLGKPLIAGVRGKAVGLGTVLLCYCDIVLAEPGSVFSTPYSRLGCFPEAAATTLLPHVLGLAQAKKLLMACARFDSIEAERCGLVTRLVSKGKLRQQLIAAGRDMLTQSPQVMDSIKEFFMRSLRANFSEVLDTEVKLLEKHWTSEDCQKRISALVDNPDSL